MGVQYFDKDRLHSAAVQEIKESDVLLDIGTGIQPRDFVKTNIYLCCEPFGEYVEKLRESTKGHSSSAFVLLRTDWKGVLNVLPDRSVDTILLIDVIEHLEKKDGELLLAETLKKAKKQVVIFTPLGFVQQHVRPDGTDAWGLNGADWQEHRSGWLPDEFDASWKILACKEYHFHDNLGNAFPKPEGAFWAIKNIETSTNEPSVAIISKTELSRLRNAEVSLQEKNQNLNTENAQLKSKLQAIYDSRAYKLFRISQKILGR